MTDSAAPRWGLVICGGEAPSGPILSGLASCCTWVVAADSGLTHALKAGIAVDCCVGDMDSFEGELPPGLELRRHPRDKDLSDTQIAIQAVLDLGADLVCLAGGGGGRMDHLLALHEVLAAEHRIKRWYTAHDEILSIRKYLGYDLGQGQELSVFALEQPSRVESSGLFWPLDGLELGQGHHSLSNRTSGASLELHIRSGRVILVRSLQDRGFIPFAVSESDA